MSYKWGTVFTVGFALFALAARGEELPYCRRVKAQAAADAALLEWPRLVLEGIRFPSSNRLDLGPTVGNNFQGRVGVVFSPLDLYRGRLVQKVGDADCAEHSSATRIEDQLAGIDDARRLSAFRAQAAYLEAHRAEWRALVAKAAKRFEARVITAVELHELRWLADSLERKLAQVHGEVRHLEVTAVPEADPSLGALADRYLVNATALDGAVEKLRATDAWTFKLSGGVIPLPGQPLDWYGLAEIGYSLGGVAHDRQQVLASLAHRDELETERRAIPARLAAVRQGGLARLAGATEELAVVESQLDTAAEAGRVLEGAEAEGADHARDTLAIERFSAEADRVFLRKLINELSSIVGANHGSS